MRYEPDEGKFNFLLFWIIQNLLTNLIRAYFLRSLGNFLISLICTSIRLITLYLLNRVTICENYGQSTA